MTVVRGIINAYGQTVNKAFGDRSKTVGASEIGLCARRVAFTKRGTPTDDQTVLESNAKTPGRRKRYKSTQSKQGSLGISTSWGAHVRGSVMERELWVPSMRAKFGTQLKMAGKYQQTLTKNHLSATPDGIVVGPLARDLVAGEDAVVVECKTIDPRVNLLEEKKSNAYQVQVQMGLIRDSTPYKPNYAVISYIDASFWHEVVEFTVKYDPNQYAAAHMRATKILRADPQDLRPEGWIAGGKECGWCPFAKRCGEMRGQPPAEQVDVDPQFRAEIIDLCKQANQLQLSNKEGQDKFRDLQDQIRTRLKEKGVSKIPGVVNWYGIRGRDAYDVEAMAATLKKLKVDVEQFKTTGDPTSGLSIDKKVSLL